jgi:FecR protein
MNPAKKCTATKLAAALALLLASQAGGAEPAGVVSDSTGPLLAKTATGSIKVLAAGSSVETLDTLISRPGVYARVILTDHSDLALGPDTELAIESYSFHDKSSEANSAVLRLSKGSVRVTSGALGARDTDTYTLAAGPTTIAIHHSVFIATYTDGAKGEIAQRGAESTPTYRAPALAMYHSPTLAARDHTYLRVASYPTHPTPPLELTDSPLHLAQSVPTPGGGALPPGLYVQVLDGMINVTNPAGSQNFAAGQFGYTPNIKQPPVIVPANPGMQFTPPPAFSAPTSGTPGSVGKSSNAVDCVVR